MNEDNSSQNIDILDIFTKNAKNYHDDIHGEFPIHEISVAIIDTDVFQRLLETKQAGKVKHVYQTATHSRLEHSIGVSYLSTKLVSTLFQYMDPKLKESVAKEDLLCIMLAALLHDVGHGPWSHLWDQAVAEKDDNWTHEKGSGLLLDFILKTEKTVQNMFSKYNLKENHIEFIKELICAEKSIFASPWPFKARPESCAWMYEIVSNHTFGIDVDRADYFQRDAVRCGLDSGKATFSRYISQARVKIDAETGRPVIAVPKKDLMSLFEEFFQKRYKLHTTVYQHKTVKKIELMQTDVLMNSQDIYRDMYGPSFPELRFMHRDMKFYSKLDEGAIENMIRCSEFKPEVAEKYTKARTLLQRVAHRQFYPTLATSETWDDSKVKCHKKFIKLINDKIGDKQLTDLIKNGMLVVIKSKFNYGDGEENPMKNFRYFKKTGDDAIFRISDNQKELDLAVMPARFQSVQFTLVYKGMSEEEIGARVLEKIVDEFDAYF